MFLLNTMVVITAKQQAYKVEVLQFNITSLCSLWHAKLSKYTT